jgi:hypothetical protein
MKHLSSGQKPRHLKNGRIAILAFVIFGILNLWIPHNEVWAAPYSYSYTNDGNVHDINPLSGNMSASDYYDYYRWDGHPDFGAEADTAFLWLWEDLLTNEVSLGIIFNSPRGGGHRGSANITFGDTPDNAKWVLKDDPGDHWNGWTVGWRWVGRHTDGGVMGGLGNSPWDIDIAVNSSSGIKNWYFLSDGDDKYAHSLNIKNGVTASARSQVPEPATFLLLGVGLAGFFARTIKRKSPGGQTT